MQNLKGQRYFGIVVCRMLCIIKIEILGMPELFVVQQCEMEIPHYRSE